MRIVITNHPEDLRAELIKTAVYAVVEAEYGSVEVMGSSDALTLNHHVRSDRRCPCLIDNTDPLNLDIIGISHFDLDTLGGVLALMGEKPPAPAFWELSAWVDTHGPHRARECPGYTAEAHRQMAAFWAWSEGHRLFVHRDGGLHEVSHFFEAAREELVQILAGEREGAAEEFLSKEAALRVDSYVEEVELPNGQRVVLRSAESFVNHLYYRRDGSPADFVVGFSKKFKSVTVSRASDGPFNCKDFVQNIWGMEAGGHPGIAGSPRGKEMTLDDARRAASLMPSCLAFGRHNDL